MGQNKEKEPTIGEYTVVDKTIALSGDPIVDGVITYNFTVMRSNITISAEGILKPGITTLMGPSGSGKSTIIKTLAGLTKPTGGWVKANGIAWVDVEAKIWKLPQERRVGYMPQGNIVFPHMTVEQNITYSKRGDETLLIYLLERLGLGRYRGTKARHLSGGEQQRVALGRALYAKPDLLLLDEPLTALDWDLRHQVQKDIVDIIKEWHISCLWVTHNREEAEEVGDVLIQM